MTKNNFDFWVTYDNLCTSLRHANKNVIVDRLKEAQMCATGMTDGWFNFLFAFEKVIQDNTTVLSNEEKMVADDLILKLKASLNNR